MNDKLRDAIDHLQDLISSGQLIDHTDHRELEAVLEAAWRYWDSQDGEYDGY